MAGASLEKEVAALELPVRLHVYIDNNHLAAAAGGVGILISIL